MKLKFSRQNFEKYKYTEFHENPSNGRRDVLSGRMEGHHEVKCRFSQFCERTKKPLNLYSPVVIICTAQWSLYVPHSGHYMYGQFNIQQFYVLPTHCIYAFCVDLRTNSDYFPIQH